ncbi:MAG: glycine zipper domain-containing protein [Candidatus Rhabdochlamydia sp.]
MVDWTGGATGALAGASAGATIGSAIPVVGTAVGAGVGGLFGGVAGLFGNKKKKKKKVSSLDKNQQALNEKQHQALMGEGPLADLYNYDPEAANAVFDQNIANPAYRKFNEEIVPGITGQFRNKGLMNSSYAGDAIAKLARDVQENLNSQRTQYLYGEQKDAQNAKRNAVENIQNRQTFAYDKSASNGGGFDINKVLKSITPEMIEQAKNYFSSTAGTA